MWDISAHWCSQSFFHSELIICHELKPCFRFWCATCGSLQRVHSELGCVPNSMSLRQCDSVTLWQCDSVTVWQCDRVEVWQRVSVTLWHYDTDTLSAWQCVSVLVCQCDCVSVCNFHTVTVKDWKHYGHKINGCVFLLALLNVLPYFTLTL